MRVLILCDRHPYPPINGLYVPICEFLASSSKWSSIHVDLLLPDESSLAVPSDFNATPFFNKIFQAKLKRRSVWRIVWDVITFRLPPYAVSLDLKGISFNYDIAIATPDGLFNTLETIKALQPNCRTLLWINEPYYTVALGQCINFFKAGLTGIPSSLIFGLKFIIIKLHERRYLRRLDGAVVQTRKELARYRAMVGDGARYDGFVSANPIKAELLQVHRGDGRGLLIHAPRRVDEIRGFVENFSRRSLDAGLDCIVRICVGDVAPYVSSFGHLPNVQIISYQERLSHVYEGIFAAAVFTRQRYGLVNRIKEAMTAGVAVIAYPEALFTLGDVRFGLDAIAARCDRDFVDAGIQLAKDKELASRIGQQAREFVLRNEIEGPDQLVAMLLDSLRDRKDSVQA